MEELEEALTDQILQLASGVRRTHNEMGGFREISIFKDGVIL